MVPFLLLNKQYISNMLTRNALPLVDLPKSLNSTASSTLQHALVSFGAFRLAVPPSIQHLSEDVFKQARTFFTQQPDATKQNISGYSGFGTELVRGEIPMPKESVYFFRRNDMQQRVAQHQQQQPPQDLHRSVTLLYKEWKPVRHSLLNLLSTTLDPNIPLTGTPSLDYDSLGVHYYDTQRLDHDNGGVDADLSPAHMDSGTVTILFRDPSHGDDMLEVADLTTTSKLDSKGVGMEASFIPVPVSVPAAPNEVVVLAGTRLQRLLGRERVRACVHRVRGPGQRAVGQGSMSRLGMAIFCAPSVAM